MTVNEKNLKDMIDTRVGLNSDASTDPSAASGTVLSKIRGVGTDLDTKVGDPADAAVDPDGGSGTAHAKIAGLGARIGDNTEAATDPSAASGTTFSKLRGIGSDLDTKVGDPADAAVEPDGGVGTLHAKVAGLGDQLEVPSTDSTADVLLRDAAGAKADTANETPGTTSSLMRYAKGSLQVLGTRADSAVTSPSSTATAIAYLKGILNSIGTGTSGTADAGSTASTLVDAARTEAATDYFDGALVVMETGANTGLASIAIDFNATTDTITVEPAFPNAIAAGDEYTIIPRQAFPALNVALNATGLSVTTNSLVDQLYIAAGEQLRNFIAKTGGTVLSASKSLVKSTSKG